MNIEHIGKFHELKTWHSFYEAIVTDDLSLRKTLEVRLNDRGFEIGDILVLQEYDPTTDEYTSRQCLRMVTHIVDDTRFGLKEGYVAMSILPVKMEVVDTTEGSAK